jgi:DNA-binding MarR family transcriptional regulator
MTLSIKDLPELNARVLRGLELSRELASRTIMFHQTVAERLGLNLTDLKCLDLAREAGGPISAGRLAEVTGLTSGAITGVIDHLEQAGLARRVRDPRDRRKVLVEPVLEPLAGLLPIYQELGRAMAQVCMQYNERELAVVYRFLEQTIAVLKQQTERLRGETANTNGPAAAQG